MSRIAGAFVGVFYVFAVLTGIILLAVVQLRSSSGSAFDTWRLNYDANRVLAATYQQYLDNAVGDLFRNMDSLNFTEGCLNLFHESGEPKQITQEILDEVKQAKEAKMKYEDLEWNDARCFFRGRMMLEYDKAYYQAAKLDIEKRITTLEEAIKSANLEYVELIKDRRDFLAFKEMERTWYSRLFVEIPYDLLVLLLVMLMGALGGMVRLLRDYGDPSRTNPSSRDYFFIPLIGSVVAIGGYVLAKTGLLLLSSSREETSLSPFMISLVGIVSGLLAREVIDNIAGAGRKLLTARETAEAKKDRRRTSAPGKAQTASRLR